MANRDHRSLAASTQQPSPQDPMADDSSLSSSTSESSSSQIHQRNRPASLRLQSVGVDPSLLVGKVLKRVRRSSTHPSMSFSFSDGTTYQILVDGYDPRYKGLPKKLESDSALDYVFNPPGGSSAVDLLVTDCTLVRLSDNAFDSGPRGIQRWTQSHLAIAFKFGGELHWHCIWATLEVRDDDLGSCIFRSFDDIYLQPRQQQQRSSEKRKDRLGKRCDKK